MGGLARVVVAIPGGPASATIGSSTSSTRRVRPIGRRLRGVDDSTPRDKIERPGDRSGGEALGSTAAAAAALLPTLVADSGGNATLKAVGLDADTSVGSLRVSSSPLAAAGAAGRGLETGRSFRALLDRG